MRKQQILALLVTIATLAAVSAWLVMRGTPGARAAATGSVATIAERDTPRAAAERRSEHALAPTRVERLSKERRRQLGEQIAAAVRRARDARAASSATGSAAAAEAADPIIPLEEVGKPLQEALQAAIPLLADCYTRDGSAAAREAAAWMTMISDPELGTVIDTDELTDAEGNVLDRELDTCLRDVIDSLALPPLGKTGRLQLQYSFRFD